MSGMPFDCFYSWEVARPAGPGLTGTTPDDVVLARPARPGLPRPKRSDTLEYYVAI